MSQPVGEIIDTSLEQFVAQACEHGVGPPFGSLVAVTDLPSGETLYGLVHEVRTVGVDPGARPVMRGREGVRDQAIYDENPDLDQVLRTEFSALLVGFRRGGQVFHILPSAPAPLHWSVHVCPADEVRAFSAQCHYLRRLLDAPGVPADELVAANVRLVAGLSRAGDDFLLRAARELADLLRDDYPRLRGIVDRIRPALGVER